MHKTSFFSLIARVTNVLPSYYVYQTALYSRSEEKLSGQDTHTKPTQTMDYIHRRSGRHLVNTGVDTSPTRNCAGNAYCSQV